MRRSFRAGRPRALVVVLLALSAAAWQGAPASADPGVPQFAPPVDAPIIEGYSAPADPYAAGNRGIEYATRPGTVVTAAGSGLVIFAGVIAGSRYVTIQHADGIRTSYSYLSAILVAAGTQVDLGMPIGLAGPIFQLGARRGVSYFDPATLWSRPRVFLVPIDGRRSAAADPYASRPVPDDAYREGGGLRAF